MLARLSSLLSLALAVTAVAGKNWDVTVGQNSQLVFNPDSITGAQPGDTVTYSFFAKNHSVTQATFQNPCQLSPGGFFSGFVPTPSPSDASRTTFTITVNDTKPIWVYCAQTTGNHCQSGMVSAINAPSTGNTLDAFKAAAKTAQTPSTSPPDGLPVGGLRKTAVDVGPGGNLTFFPNNITELPRTVIEFSFDPKNHSVVQSSFADPCHPLQGGNGGFSSGFVPTNSTSSGVTFDIVVNDTKPIWFYCAQTTKNHCQSGMVGAINAPTTGNTLDAFTQLAMKANTSTIPPNAPLGGILSINGTAVTTIGGAVIDTTGTSTGSTSDSTAVSSVPPPGSTIPPDVASMAGGAPPSSYNWTTSITDNGTNLLQLILFLDNVLLEILVGGHNSLTTGNWKNAYPASITNSFGSLTAQAMVHRSTATDSLSHYGKSLNGLCQYTIPSSALSDFVDAALVVLLLEIALVLDITGQVATTDPWMVPALSSTMGSKARMTGMVNMMQNHIPAAAAREVLLSPDLVYSYAMNHYITANSCPTKLPYTNYPPYTLNKGTITNNRLQNVKVTYDSSLSHPQMYVAWIGAWGQLEYSSLGSDGSASVPGDLYGHVFAVLTSANTAKSVNDLQGSGSIVAGPEMVWVTGAGQG